jgi:hypothetical protein
MEQHDLVQLGATNVESRIMLFQNRCVKPHSVVLKVLLKSLPSRIYKIERFKGFQEHFSHHHLVFINCRTGSVQQVNSKIVLHAFVTVTAVHSAEYSVLSVHFFRSLNGFLHLKIVGQDGSYILGQFSQPFESIPRMVEFFCQAKLPLRGNEQISLIYPLVRCGHH